MSAAEILSNLVKFKTITGTNPQEFSNCLDYIDNEMQKIPQWSYREYNSKGFISRVYSHKNYIKQDIKDFDLYLYGNIDVVDGSDSLFQIREEGGKLFGRGTIDMKFGVAVSIDVIQNLTKKILEKPIAFIVTTDEELGGINGAKYLVDEIGYKGKCVIGPNGLLDKEYFNLETSNKGTVHTKYTAIGKPSHGSRPWQGDNPLDRLIQMYLELNENFNKGAKDKWDSTINLGILKGGFATNAVPEEAFMQIDFRYVNQGQSEKYYEMESKLLNKYRIEKEPIVDAMNISVDKEHALFKTYLSIAESIVGRNNIKEIRSEGSHDVREFFKVGMLPIIFTPRGSDHHTNNEWIQGKDLETLKDINLKFISQIFK